MADCDTDKAVLITQGELAVIDDDKTYISTLLGSCVACCLWDPIQKVGGMNHLLLAVHANSEGLAFDLAGATEMERLINAILHKGGVRSNLRAKVFGGARMLESTREIGTANYKFVQRYLQSEGIPLQRASVGGRSAVMLRFWPTDGRAMLKRNSGPSEETSRVAIPAQNLPTSNDIELF